MERRRFLRATFISALGLTIASQLPVPMKATPVASTPGMIKWYKSGVDQDDFIRNMITYVGELRDGRRFYQRAPMEFLQESGEWQLEFLEAQVRHL